MLIENGMYFVLGFLASGLLALMIVPAIWRRAVRLTKKRIEAATPMTLAEYRADKDQLRAEFALSTRRLEMNVETLRGRLADQISEIQRKKTEQAKLRVERDDQLGFVRELEDREIQLRRRILDLEKEGADLAQRLRMKDRDLSSKLKEVERLRSKGGNVSAGDVDDLLDALEKERTRAERLEEQVSGLLSRFESYDQETAAANDQIAELRQSLAERDDLLEQESGSLTEAEARIANAESKLTQLLEETQSVVELEESRSGMLLAEKLTLEEELENLREKIVGVENSVVNEWTDDRVDQSHLRERLNDIASEVSRLVFSVEEVNAGKEPESLFDRIQRYSADNLVAETSPNSAGAANGTGPTQHQQEGGRLSDRMKALRDMQTSETQ